MNLNSEGSINACVAKINFTVNSRRLCYTLCILDFMGDNFVVLFDRAVAKPKVTAIVRRKFAISSHGKSCEDSERISGLNFQTNSEGGSTKVIIDWKNTNFVCCLFFVKITSALEPLL